MRICCGLVLALAAACSMWAQREPCLTGTDTPGCGITITMNPPLKLPEENTFWVPNAITIDVPLRLRPTKVQLNSGPAGTQAAANFKLFAQARHYTKRGGLARFQIDVKDCPGADNAFEVYIFSAHLPYPIATNYQPFECKQRTAR